ncbi:MAG: DnaJ domain-containing protein [bacterium]
MSAPDSTIDYYEILEVSGTASPEVIEAAYRGLMRKYGDSPDPAIREKRRFVEDAHSVLSNAERREAYDSARRGFVVPPVPVLTRLGGATVVQCARDPEVQTALRCSRCDTPICPKCLVQTPVGARCKDCAQLAKSPVYTVKGQYLVRAIAAAVIGGVAMGLIWGFASTKVPGLLFGGIFMSLILGAALGFGFTRIMELSVKRKRGPVVVACAMGGIVLATGIQMLFVGGTLFVGSILAAAAGLYFAYQNLK